MLANRHALRRVVNQLKCCVLVQVHSSSYHARLIAEHATAVPCGAHKGALPVLMVNRSCHDYLVPLTRSQVPHVVVVLRSQRTAALVGHLLARRLIGIRPRRSQEVALTDVDILGLD